MATLSARSPHFINVTATNLTSAKLELYIYTGTQTTSRPTVTYTIDNVATNSIVDFEIAELVKDYIGNEFNGTYACYNVWVDYQITKSILEVAQTPDAFVLLDGFDAYGYFNEGANPQIVQDVYLSNSTLYVNNSGVVKIPVNQDNVTSVVFNKSGVLVSTTTITATALNTAMIRYASGTDVDQAIVKNGATVLKTLTIENIEECKHTPYKLTFVNKFGALQDLWFFKRSNLSMSAEQKEYSKNIVSNGTYSINKHQKSILNKNGKEKLTLNSGFVDELMNEVFKQLILSEKVWITYGSDVLPINITSNSIDFKTRLNDKLISYTVEVEFSFNVINNIR